MLGELGAPEIGYSETAEHSEGGAGGGEGPAKPFAAV